MEYNVLLLATAHLCAPFARQHTLIEENHGTAQRYFRGPPIPRYCSRSGSVKGDLALLMNTVLRWSGALCRTCSCGARSDCKNGAIRLICGDQNSPRKAPWPALVHGPDATGKRRRGRFWDAIIRRDLLSSSGSRTTTGPRLTAQCVMRRWPQRQVPAVRPRRQHSRALFAWLDRAHCRRKTRGRHKSPHRAEPTRYRW
jgi:hypothetical protein